MPAGSGSPFCLVMPPNSAMMASSQDDGAEPYSGLRADPGAVPGASTLEACEIDRRKAGFQSF
jgi:hypothetical protein